MKKKIHLEGFVSYREFLAFKKFIMNQKLNFNSFQINYYIFFTSL